MSIRSELIKFCHKVYERGFVAAYDGNLSVRIDPNKILITPSGVCKGDLTEENLIEIDYNGCPLSGSKKPSTEFKIHTLAYKNRKDVNAVVHAHPVNATALATIGEGITQPIFPEVILSLGKVPLCKYGTPSTDQLPDSMLPHIEYVWALLLENHGAVTFGKNIEDAYFKMEKLEHAAEVLIKAKSTGRIKTLPLQKLKELYDIAESTYGIKINKKSRMDY